jgi:hypothetical protein
MHADLESKYFEENHRFCYWLAKIRMKSSNFCKWKNYLNKLKFNEIVESFGKGIFFETEFWKETSVRFFLPKMSFSVSAAFWHCWFLQFSFTKFDWNSLRDIEWYLMIFHFLLLFDKIFFLHNDVLNYMQFIINSL